MELEKVKNIYFSLKNRIELQSFKSYDPFDGLNSNFTRIISFDNQLISRSIMQLVKRSPVNIRPILGIKESLIPKSMADYLAAEILINNTDSLILKNNLRNIAEKIIKHSNNDYSGISWGLPFNYASRLCFLPKNTPNIITTAYCANSLIDYYEFSNETKFLDIALTAGDFIMKDLGAITLNQNEICICYIPTKKYAVHNANLMAASFLFRIYKYLEKEEIFAFAKKALNYSINKQRPEGSWYYGEANNLHWIDNFHTGYNLDSLYTISNNYEIPGLNHSIDIGYDYYINNFFHENGIPKFYNSRTYPIDTQTIAQAIQTLSIMSTQHNNSLKIANDILNWSLLNMYDDRGYFYSKKSKYFTSRISFIRWCQSPMLIALAHLINKNKKGQK